MSYSSSLPHRSVRMLGIGLHVSVIATNAMLLYDQNIAFFLSSNCTLWILPTDSPHFKEYQCPAVCDKGSFL